MAINVRYDFINSGVSIETSGELLNHKFRFNNPPPPAALFPRKPTDPFIPRRTVIDFEVIDNNQVPYNGELTLTIFITQEDIDATQNRAIDDVKIYKWVGDSWEPLTNENSEFWAISPPIRANSGETYVGYIKVQFNPSTDPPIAVG